MLAQYHYYVTILLAKSLAIYNRKNRIAVTKIVVIEEILKLIWTTATPHQ